MLSGGFNHHTHRTVIRLNDFGMGVKNKLAWKWVNNLDELKQQVADIPIWTSAAQLASLTGKTLLSAQLDYLTCNYFYKV